MHSHFGLQEQRLLAAPLIFIDPEEDIKVDQDIPILLADFSFKSPQKIFQKLKTANKMNSMSSNSSSPDIVEVDYDAFLANLNTLDNPEIYVVKPKERIRLRFINNSMPDFYIHLRQLKGEAIAVDGNRIQPFIGSKFEVSVAQRIDVIVAISEDEIVFPILVQGEGTDKQTGLILSTLDQVMKKYPSKLSHKTAAMTYAQELSLHALNPLPLKQPDQKIVLLLGGDMQNYVWTINNQTWPEVTPIVVEKGQRVEITFKNVSTMGTRCIYMVMSFK